MPVMGSETKYRGSTKHVADGNREGDRQGKRLKIQEEEVPSTVFTCAVCGCSSSGKTTLAVILHEIFKPFQPSSSNPLWEFLSDYQPTEILPLVHQDTFFTLKPLCPIITFKSTAIDADFIQNSIDSKADRGYFYSRTGKRAAKTPVHVTGPDTDCVESLDFEWMLKNVSTIRAIGTDQGIDIPEKKPDYVREELLHPQSVLIEEMRRKVAKWILQQTKKQNGRVIKWELSPSLGLIAKFARKFLFIEGFLIISDPDDDSLPYVNMSEPEYLKTVLKTAPAGVRKNIFKTQAEERGKRPARHSARKALMKHFDVKLFLPTEKAVAKRRRLARPVYKDPPEGTRSSGEMWKTEGYFEDVVWGGYLRDFEWMRGAETVDNEEEKVLGTDGTAENKGIRVRPIQHQDIEATVSWGVDTILSSFEGD